MGEQGLAAASAGISNMYGNGEGQNTTHYYAGKIKKKGSSMACKTKKPGKK